MPGPGGQVEELRLTLVHSWSRTFDVMTGASNGIVNVIRRISTMLAVFL
jgi:hypothetical protein